MVPELVLLAEKNKILPDDLGIPAEVRGFLLWYQFKPLVSLLRGNEPYLFLEFESSSTRGDKSRMFFYGSGMTGKVELFLMYEKDERIQHVQLVYSLNSLESRLEFFATIYNIIDRDPIPNLSQTISNLIQPLIKLAPKSAISNLPSKPAAKRGRRVVPDPSITAEAGNRNDDAESRKRSPSKRQKKNNGAASPGGPVVDKKWPDDEGGDDGSGNPGRRGREGGRRGGAGAEPGFGAGNTANGIVTRAKAKGAQEGEMESAQAAQEILTQEGYNRVLVLHGNILTMTKDSFAARKTNLVAKIVRSNSEQKFYRRHLKHPNVIKAEAIIPTPYVWNIVVLPELVSLESSLNHKTSFTFLAISGMCNGLGNGLQFLHDHRIAHMDIKPSNLVYHPTTFTLQIIDLNLAIWVRNSNQTVTGSQGTPGWMAPEVVSGSPFKPLLADLFSCGIVLYRLVDVVWPEPNEVAETDRIRDFSRGFMDPEPSLRPSLKSFTRRKFRAVNH
ncbi:hypothetical protein D9757_012461 [Collybiopsis confluens]|uniref:Protein kinase domain-containing protein n=1 Tax=Collybiopsis confluens TaxID=2823264 RepID=A0A8H5G188_9AGAR|nr:hypothetical protein D9757_012461 [Collybiopsis confluens]